MTFQCVLVTGIYPMHTKFAKKTFVAMLSSLNPKLHQRVQVTFTMSAVKSTIPSLASAGGLKESVTKMWCSLLVVVSVSPYTSLSINSSLYTVHTCMSSLNSGSILIHYLGIIFRYLFYKTEDYFFKIKMTLSSSL